jgi:hypothetical protein
VSTRIRSRKKKKKNTTQEVKATPHPKVGRRKKKKKKKKTPLHPKQEKEKSKSCWFHQSIDPTNNLPPSPIQSVFVSILPFPSRSKKDNFKTKTIND